MRPSRWARGGRAALLLGGLTLLLTGCSVQGWEKRLRFGEPTGVTREGIRMRVLYTWSGVVALALGVIVWGLIFWACLRYRKKSDELPRQTKYNFLIEIICVTFPFIVIAGLFWRTVVVEDDVNKITKNPDVKVQVDAFKWNWKFEYHSYRVGGAAKPTTEAYAGKKDPTGGGGPLYLSTVGSQNEIPVLVVPIGKTVVVEEHSMDVNHSFWVPEFLFKRDVIPYGNLYGPQDRRGSSPPYNKFEFVATQAGSYVGRCAELCGVYHSEMNFEVRVVSVATFGKYLAALKSFSPDDPGIQHKALAKAGMAPYATTTYPFTTNRTNQAPSTRGRGAGS